MRVDFLDRNASGTPRLGAQTMPDNCQFLQGENVVLSGKETIEDMSTIRGMHWQQFTRIQKYSNFTNVMNILVHCKWINFRVVG